MQAREVAGVLRVSIPATMTKAEENRWVAEMVRRLERRAATDATDLVGRAKQLAHRYGLPLPTSIRWSDNQEWRWGSCTPVDGTIRVSSRLGKEPRWVLDYVIVHELAHLLSPRHDARFWTLVNRYPRSERARGFLIARGAEPSEDLASGDLLSGDLPSGDLPSGDLLSADLPSGDLLSADLPSGDLLSGDL